MTFASDHPDTGPVCARPGCNKPTVSDWLYCSEACFNMEHDPTPITVLQNSPSREYLARKWDGPIRRITRSSKEDNCE